jgi:DNA-binding CsgD family transcriptional regulator
VIEGIASGRTDLPEAPPGLTPIRHRMATATTGEGALVYVEGASGAGKTQLVLAAAEAARIMGMDVLHATGHELEREFPFGVAVQLLEDSWFAITASERTTLMEGPARWAGQLLSGAPLAAHGSPRDDAYEVIHGLFCLVRAMVGATTGSARGRPVALIVDDVDYADAASLRFLAYLAPRIRQLPIAVVVSARPAAANTQLPALSALRSASDLVVLDPPDHIASTMRSAVPVWPRVSPLEHARTEGPRAVAARTALRKSLAEGHRESVSDLAELAWSEGALLDSHEGAAAWPVVATSLLFVDELERAVEIAQAAARSGQADGSRDVVHACHGWSLYHQGRVAEALVVARAAVARQRDDLAARGLFAACRLAQGRREEAEAALAVLPDVESIEELDAIVMLDVRAQLRLAQMRPADALADAMAAGRLCRAPRGVLGPGVAAWRSTAALARLALGETMHARALAEEEIELARTRGLGRVVIRDLRILAIAAGGTRTLDLLAEAVRIGRAVPPRLEYMNALVDLGAATRRANQRTAARHPLRQGLEFAERGGVEALARRAREELEATGARSRRVILTGIKALTPSERRVADLAADGLTTRQIARALFVTPKTVEFHLRHVYRKLDIRSSRGELARALSLSIAE